MFIIFLLINIKTYYLNMLINEVEELYDNILPNQINLKSFEIKDKLNPKIWQNNKMKKNVRKKILQIAKEFIEYLDFSKKITPLDIIIVGSIANYNWSKYSDIDLHIIFDFNDINSDTQLVTNYVYQIKSSWNDIHKNLSIYGYDVELYVQNKDDDVKSNGIYSVKNDLWLKFPEDLANVNLDKSIITDTASKIINKIELYEKISKKIYLKKSIKLLYNKVEYLYNNIVKLRKSSLSKDGEFGPGNIIFKILRRSLYLERIHNLRNEL